MAETNDPGPAHPEVVRRVVYEGTWPEGEAFPLTPLEAWYVMQGWAMQPAGGINIQHPGTPAGHSSSAAWRHGRSPPPRWAAPSLRSSSRSPPPRPTCSCRCWRRTSSMCGCLRWRRSSPAAAWPCGRGPLCQ